MKPRQLFPILIVLVLLNACGTDKAEKKVSTDPASKDSVIENETLPPIEKEFADSVSTTPVKDSVLLKFNFLKGKVYDYTMNFNMTQNREDQSRATTMKWNYRMEVVDSKKNIKTIKATYKTIAMTMDMGNGQKMEFSSEKETDPMDFMQLPSKMFSIIKGKSFTMQVDEKGEIVAVSGFDKIGEAVVSEMKLPEQMKPIMQQNFKKQFNDEAAKEMFSQSFNIFPAKYVKTGDKWQKTTAFTPIQQSMTTNYTVKNIKGNRVYLTGESKTKSSDGKVSGSQTSKLIIDARTGLMIDGVFDQKNSAQGKMNTRGRITGREI